MANAHSSPTFISLRDLALDLGLSRKTVRRLLHGAGVKAFVLSPARNGSVRYRRHEIDSWLRQQREQ